MTNAEREARIKQIKEEIAYYTGILESLKTIKEDIEKTEKSMNDSVVDPIKTPYDLSEEDKWRGTQYEEAVRRVTAIGSDLDSYVESVDTLVGQLQTAMDEVQEKIDELNDELASL